MTRWWALYVKEWKEARHVFAFLMIAIALLEGYGWFYFTPNFAQVGPLSFIPFVLGGAACFVAPPFLLARAFSSEWKSDTHYQWFSLPVPKFVPALAKYLVAVSNGLLMFLLAAGFTLITGIEQNSDPNMPRVAYDDIVVLVVLGFLAYLILILGFVTAMEGVKFTVKRFQRLTAVGFWILAMYFYFDFYGYAVHVLDFLGTFEVDSVMNGQSMMVVHEFAWANFVYPACVGFLLLGLGLALFEKHVEI